MSHHLRAILVDDEPITRELLRAMLHETGMVSVIAECRNAEEAIAAIKEHAPDVVFLDVDMSGGAGFGVIEAIGVEHMPAVVFATAYDHYASQAFDGCAIEYLLKPFDDRRLKCTLQRLTE
jgi:two-component system, LytTR family, response regulator